MSKWSLLIVRSVGEAYSHKLEKGGGSKSVLQSSLVIKNSMHEWNINPIHFQSQSLCEKNVFVKHRCPRWQQSQTMANISKSYILTPPHPQGHVMSVKCEQPLDELKVQVWLQYDNPNFKYCTLFISGTDRRTDGRTNGQTIQPLDAPGGPFRPGA